jgi:hypothetical protein
MHGNTATKLGASWYEPDLIKNRMWANLMRFFWLPTFESSGKPLDRLGVKHCSVSLTCVVKLFVVLYYLLQAT